MVQVVDFFSFLAKTLYYGRASERLQPIRITGQLHCITTIHKGFPDGSTVTYNSVILAYLLGHFVESAQVEKLPPMWDLPLGSGQFDQTPLYEPMSDITLELFTFKMVFLVQLALG